MKHTKSIIVGALALVMLMPMFAAFSASAEPLILEEIELETGSTDKFGGGDFVSLNLRNAKFAVLYGNETNPNHIVIAKEFDRFLGGVDVHRSDGQLFQSRPIMVRTVFGQRFLFAVEFEDSDNDMMLTGAQEGELHRIKDHEPVKATSMNRTWSISEITEGENADGNRTWEFTLTATDLLYDRIWEVDGTGNKTWRKGEAADGQVEEISFIFHISIGEKEFDAPVPWFNVTIERQRPPPPVIGIDPARNRTFNGTSIVADVKYDHYIEGWDFESDENNLALETHAFMGFHRPPPPRRQHRDRSWMGDGEDFEQRLGGMGEARFMDKNMTEVRMNFTGPMPPRLVQHNEIHFADNWTRITRFRWVSDVEVTNGGQTTTEEMFFQVHGGEKAMRKGFNGQFFQGFEVRGAFLYPAGEVLFHDPSLETEVTFMDIGSQYEAVGPTGIIMEVAIAVIAIGAVLGYKLTTKNSKKK